MPITISRRPSRRKRQKWAILGSAITLLIVLVLYYSHGSSPPHPRGTAKQASVPPVNLLLDDQAKFWRSIYQIILNNDPRCDQPPDIVIPEKFDIAYENDHIHNRPDVLWVKDSDLQRMRIAHQTFVDDLLKSRTKLIYRKGTRGIITTVSDTQIPILLIQLRMLRSTRSSLPVEVFLTSPTAYTEHVCRNILSRLDAICVYFSTIFTAAGTGVSIDSYQYKIFAILFSSFDEVLLLDSDAWPIMNPDHLFTYPPFTDTGLVLWPDFWYASESPYYFSIANIKNPPLLHTKPATESGELMYAKSKHEKSILLAAYYNYYGPKYYYPLQSQGAPGQGDKETFGAAALALKEDYYMVKTMVTAIGRTDSSGYYLGSAMIQYDPIVDFQQGDLPPPQLDTAGGEKHDRPQGQQGNTLPKQITPPRRVNKPMFVHANFPKFDPRTIFNERDIGSGVKASTPRDSNGTFVRCWDINHDAAVAWFGYDVERRFWEVIKIVACDDLVGEGEASRKVKEAETCEFVKRYIKNVFG